VAAAAFGLRSVYVIGAAFLIVVAILLASQRRTARPEGVSGR
jgi:hypothetical protein